LSGRLDPLTLATFQWRVASKLYDSPAVLDALARALRLSPAERHHLHLIARGQVPLAPHVPAPVSDSLLILLDGMPLLPAYVIDFRLDILARNSAAAALFGEGFGAGELANAAHLLFLAPRMRRMQRDWARVAREMVGNLRANLARHHDDVRLRTLIAELGERSSEFAAWWQDHTVQQRAHGAKRIVHPAVGELTVCYDALATQEGSDQCLIVVTPADSAAEQSLRTLVAGRANQLAGPGVHAIAG